MVPVVEEEPLQECGKLLEERDPGTGTEAESPVAGVQELEGRVQEEGEDVEGGQNVGQVAFSMPEVVFETVSPDLESLDVLVLDLPPGPARPGQRDERVFGERMIGDPGVVVENLAGVRIGDGEFEPVCEESVVRIAEGEIGHKPEGPAFPDDLGDPLALGLSLAPGEGDVVVSDLSGTSEVLDPLGDRGMGGRLAGEEEVKPGIPGLFAKGLVGIEVVAQKGDVPGGIVGPPGIEPAGGRPNLAVLFFPAVFPDDELRGKRHDPGLSRGHQGRRHRNVPVQDASVRTMGDVTGGTVDRAVRGEGVGAIQGGPVQDPVVRQASLGPQRVSDLLDQRGHRLRPDRIQHVPDLGVRRHVVHAEEGLHIVPPGGAVEILLEGQERGTLREEHREGRTGRIVHAELPVVPGLAGIRKSAESGGNPVHKTLGLAGKSIRSGVRNPKDFHDPRMPENTRCVQ